MSTTKVRFWGGLRSIGGTVVSIEYNNARVLFDFGTTYNPAARIFDGQVKVRTTTLVRDYLKLGMIPGIDGIYTRESLKYVPDIVPYEEYEGETAFIISHLHLDHIGAIGLIAPEIPVYFTPESNHLYDALKEIGEGVPGERTYQSCEINQTFSIGEIKITPVEINHDILGSCGYHIETPDGAFVYTGDLRLHGLEPEITERFIDVMKKKGFDVLIMEGTTLRDEEELPELVADPSIPEDMTTEKNIPDKVAAKLKETEGIGIFNIYHRNIDRIKGMIMAGRQLGRKVVFEPETAYLASKLTDQIDFVVYESEQTRKERKSKQLSDFKAFVLEKFEPLSAFDINKNPGEYLVQNTYENSLELFDLNLENGVYIHSNGVPLGEFDPAFENLQRILERFKIEYTQIGCSGHAIPSHLQYILERFDPKILIPLHSFYPERLVPKNGVQLLPRYAVTYTFEDGNMKEV